MTKPCILIVCNALDDVTRLQRGIATDSPAASRKVFMLCQSLRMAGVRPYVLSLGRGKADGSGRYFPFVVRRVGGIPVVYAPFSHLRGVSELISLFSFVGLMWRLARHRAKAVIYYNRMVAYLPALVTSALMGYRNILDLEDGEVPSGRSAPLKCWLQGLISRTFDRLCSDGALLACSALERVTKARPTLCYYGATFDTVPVARCCNTELRVLMSGTIAPDTGADLLIEAIRILRRTNADWALPLSIEVTGKGPSVDALRALAAEPGVPRVTVLGRLSDAEYRDVLRCCDVGLALKPIGGPLADTTFPSKVIEFASVGLLVLSTEISDVRQLMGSGAVYLSHNDPHELIRLLQQICDDRRLACTCAAEGLRTVTMHCSAPLVGQAVADFIFRAHR